MVVELVDRAAPGPCRFPLDQVDTETAGHAAAGPRIWTVVRPSARIILMNRTLRGVQFCPRGMDE